MAGNLKICLDKSMFLDWWMSGWVGRCKSHFKDCWQKSKNLLFWFNSIQNYSTFWGKSNKIICLISICFQIGIISYRVLSICFKKQKFNIWFCPQKLLHNTVFYPSLKLIFPLFSHNWDHNVMKALSSLLFALHNSWTAPNGLHK